MADLCCRMIVGVPIGNDSRSLEDAGAFGQAKSRLSPQRPRQGQLCPRKYREPYRRCRRPRQRYHRAGDSRPGAAGVPLDIRNPDISKRVGQFSKAGLEFAACGNTMKSQNVGLRDLLPGFVAAERGGVVRIAELQSQGYLYLRP